MSRRSRAGSRAATKPAHRLWANICFRDFVLSNAFSADFPDPPRCEMATLVESIALVTSQLAMLQENTSSLALRNAAGRTHAAFKRCLELCRLLPNVKDSESIYSLLSSFVARIKALEPGSVVVIPGGWKGGLVFFVLHCVTTEAYTLAVCSVGDGLEFHPTRADPATGKQTYNSPLLLRDIPVRFAPASSPTTSMYPATLTFLTAVCQCRPFAQPTPQSGTSCSKLPSSQRTTTLQLLCTSTCFRSSTTVLCWCSTHIPPHPHHLPSALSPALQLPGSSATVPRRHTSLAGQSGTEVRN
jgi:hypothetical protein